MRASSTTSSPYVSPKPSCDQRNIPAVAIFYLRIKQKKSFNSFKSFANGWCTIQPRESCTTTNGWFTIQSRQACTVWWAGRESNSHELPHTILSRARLPISPPAQKYRLRLTSGQAQCRTKLKYKLRLSSGLPCGAMPRG